MEEDLGEDGEGKVKEEDKGEDGEGKVKEEDKGEDGEGFFGVCDGLVEEVGLTDWDWGTKDRVFTISRSTYSSAAKVGGGSGVNRLSLGNERSSVHHFWINLLFYQK
ncbi:hypothetical protein JCGZ_11041 [Jatropha curcas]|uniref:Uncharacterized protein n=1 Tax=Jatropha curcas TaxID=180498 RepID=A0A067KFR1_JATCU|nr:hypothetical protein JCGZ_11041 [Jatropha curcas]